MDLARPQKRLSLLSDQWQSCDRDVRCLQALMNGVGRRQNITKLEDHSIKIVNLNSDGLYYRTVVTQQVTFVEPRVSSPLRPGSELALSSLTSCRLL